MQITYQPAVGGTVTLNGIFDAQYILAKSDGEAGVETLGPAAFFSRSEVAKMPVDPELDDPTLVIRGVTYSVTERRSAGLGALVLVLIRVA